MEGKRLVSDSFAAEDFDALMVNVQRVPSNKSIMKTFDIFSYKEFRADVKLISKNMLLRYIVYMYDKNSPFRKKIADIDKRKYEAALYSGFEVDEEGRFKGHVEDLIMCRDKIVNKMIVRYVRQHRNHRFSYLVALEKSYYNLMDSVMDGDDVKVLKLKQIQDEIENTTIDVANSDNNRYLVDSLYDFMEEEELGLRPEDIAKKLRDGVVPISETQIQED